jgi:hypothetical protein
MGIWAWAYGHMTPHTLITLIGAPKAAHSRPDHQRTVHEQLQVCITIIDIIILTNYTNDAYIII